MSRQVVFFSWLLLIGLGSVAPAGAQGSIGNPTCSTVGQNTFVRNTMREYYLWYEHMPNANPSRYSSPEAYLEAVRYKQLDSHFSYITTKAANDAFYSESQFIGYGLSTTTSESEMRVLQVFNDSPASEAGLARGDRILEINGRSVSSLIASGQIGNAFGPSEIGVETRVRFAHRDGEERTATLTKRPVTIPTVSLTRGNVFAQFRHNDRNTRYDETLRFEELEPTLNLARLFVIATRSSASASELVINSLRPFIPVTVIGDRTYGKPVGQYGIDFCDKVLAPVAFSLVNADGQGDYFDGIAADCAAQDDIEHDLGAMDEGSLA